MPTGAVAALADVVKAAKGGSAVPVSGYHDASGDPAKNAELAKQRAMNVAAALKMAGVAEDKVELARPAQTAADGPPGEVRRPRRAGSRSGPVSPVLRYQFDS